MSTPPRNSTQQKKLREMREKVQQNRPEREREYNAELDEPMMLVDFGSREVAPAVSHMFPMTPKRPTRRNQPPRVHHKGGKRAAKRRATRKRSMRRRA